MLLLNKLAAINPNIFTVDPLDDPNKVYNSPGVVGFVAVFFLMLAATLLVLDMVRRVRRVRYRQEIQEKLAGETAAKRRKANK